MDVIPVQRSLGVLWDRSSDSLTFEVSLGERPFTGRGALSIINSLHDPLGLATPVIIKGKFLLRAMTAHLSNFQPGDWGKPLPEEQRRQWESWCKTLQAFTLLKVPRCYTDGPFKEAKCRELHTF